MKETAPNPTKLPWHVYTDSGHFRSGHDSEAEANATASAANDRAKKLGIKTRYEAKARADRG